MSRDTTNSGAPGSRQGGRRFVGWLGWIGFVFCFSLLMAQSWMLDDYFDTTGGLQPKFHSGDASSGNKIAVIEISGVLLEGDGFVKRQIDRVRADENVRAVVLRINTPGGTVTASDYLHHHLKRLREERELPIVVSMGSMATSGGYYIAMAVGEQPDSIFAEPTTTTGSIGVILPHYNLSGLMERLHVKNDSIVSHQRKQMLSMTRPPNKEHRELMQQQVDDSFLRFKQIVHLGRPDLRREDNQLLAVGGQDPGRDLATGEVFGAEQAVEFGLVDQIGFLEDAIKRAREIAELDDAQVINYQRPASVAGWLGLAQARTTPEIPPGEMPWAVLRPELLRELSMPRPYYLSSSFF